MTLFKKATKLLRNESKRPWSEVNSWALALIGGPSFLVGSYYLWKVKEVAPDLIHATEQVGITSLGIAVYGIVGVMLVGAWHFLAIAKRCSELLQHRLYK
ncbi:hypothetical protein IRZ48_05500 [Pseudomonas fulva]|uniref:hypothetical protein n=1 Tax=Pseudomonas fulva TaxID=47880 RepID=UPI0018AAAEBB|nr:hypothetical protein [Pseudomonas fulva]MBF8636090.1 hypothetical protein [Pseudomonas fulva]MBF8688057.1 hypothetical protein [Pseudomonas fulva]